MSTVTSTDTSTVTSAKPVCLYCGNNPVNHTAVYLYESVLIYSMPLTQTLNTLNHPLLYTLLHNTLLTWWMRSLEILHLITFNTELEKACSGRSQVVWEEANRRGIRMEQVCISGKPCEQYRAFLHGRWHYFTSLPIPPWANRHAYTWMDSKVRLKKFFTHHGVRVPKGGPARTMKDAEAMFHAVEKPVIAKPENGSRGRHSLTNLGTLEEVRHGFRTAQQLCCRVVIEEHLVGSVYRATYVGGNIVGILRGDPPRVTGDGRATIAELIQKKNEEKPERVKDVLITEVTKEFLLRQGYTLESVVPFGKTIDLLEKIGLSYGGDSAEEFPHTHPKLLRMLQKAGDVLGVPIVGFDFISEDITKDPDTVRWGIIEANSMPFIDLHHFPRQGTPINVAKEVWDLWGV